MNKKCLFPDTFTNTAGNVFDICQKKPQMCLHFVREVCWHFVPCIVNFITWHDLKKWLLSKSLLNTCKFCFFLLYQLFSTAFFHLLIFVRILRRLCLPHFDLHCQNELNSRIEITTKHTSPQGDQDIHEWRTPPSLQTDLNSFSVPW
jgi:hypothetical protein